MIILQDFQNLFELCNNLAQLLPNFERLNNKHNTKENNGKTIHDLFRFWAWRYPNTGYS